MLITYKKLVPASKVRSSYYINHIWLRRLLWHLWSLFHPFPGMFFTNFVCKNPRTDNIMMFDFTDSVDKGLCQDWGFLLGAAINWSRSFLRTPAVHDIVSCPPSTPIWSYSHPIAYCFLSLLLLALHIVLKCASWVIFSVATIAASWWTNWCLYCCCV